MSVPVAGKTGTAENPVAPLMPGSPLLAEAPTSQWPLWSNTVGRGRSWRPPSSSVGRNSWGPDDGPPATIPTPTNGFLTREQWEEHERQWLAPWAMKSADSRGRQYPDPERPYRSAFQRDRDRVVHTTAFRRLEYKTQVFVTYEGDYYRTRLTHTIEVSQIARTIGRALRANEDLVEAIAMAI